MGHQCDYTAYRIKPQRNMGWPRAVQFMLQSEANEVIGLPVVVRSWEASPTVFKFRISKDRVLQYRTSVLSDWENAAGHGFNHFRRFDAADLNCAHANDDLQQQIDDLRAQIQLMKRLLGRATKGRGK